MLNWHMRRQFIIAPTAMDIDGPTSIDWGKWRVHLGEEATAELRGNVCFIGRAADVDTAEPVTATSLDLLHTAGGLRRVVDFTDQMAGRFLVLIADGDTLWAVPDGWASLQTFWHRLDGGGTVLTSSPGLMLDLGLGRGDRTDPERTGADRTKRGLEYRSAGPWCPVSGARRLRANHLLDLTDGAERPRSLRRSPTGFRYLTAAIGRAIEGLQRSHGGETWLPITAGFDSRWLALAVAEAGLKANFFTFVTPGRASIDAEIGARIARRLGAEHAAIDMPSSVSDAVRAEVTAVRGAWRDLDKMAEIEFFSTRPERPLVLNGNGGEILRGGYYGGGPRLPGRLALRGLCLGSTVSPFDGRGFDHWYRSALSRPEGREVALDELFYWEQRMAHWGSEFYAEKENHVDELSPFCCRRFLLAGPAVLGRRNALPVAGELAAQGVFEGIPVNPEEPGSRTGALRRVAVVRSIGNTIRAARRPPARRPG
ncbi:MAG: hypothetical protein AAGD35_12725 [Actinomycetota bacterium]